MSEDAYKAAFAKAAELLAGRVNMDGAPLPAPGFFERWKLRRALAAFKRAAALAPKDNAAPLLMLGKIAERLGDFDESARWLERARSVDPANILIGLELGASLAKLGLFKDSAAALAPYARVNPNDARIHCNLGLSLLLAGDAAGAISAFDRLSRLEPDNPMNDRLLDLAVAVSMGKKPVPKSEADVARNL